MTSTDEFDRMVTRTLSEKVWLAQVRQMASLYGWRTYHTHRSDHSEPGFPDLVLVRANPRSDWGSYDLIFAELKTERGKLTGPQHGWLEDLRRVPGIRAEVWRPSDRETVRALLEQGLER